jgi:integrase
MPRQRVGTIIRHDDHWDARITLDDGSRKLLHLPAGLSEAMAREKAAHYSEVARGAVRVPKPGDAKKELPVGETFKQYAERWLDAREKRGVASTKNDRSSLRTHVFPLIGDKAIVSVTSQDIEALVQSFDKKIAMGTSAWGTMRRVWVIISKLFKDTRRSKDLSLRVRQDNPCLDVAGPDGGVERMKAYLYPSEFLAFTSCAAVPLRWRRVVAVSVYLALRAGELRSLR